MERVNQNRLRPSGPTEPLSFSRHINTFRMFARQLRKADRRQEMNLGSLVCEANAQPTTPQRSTFLYTTLKIFNLSSNHVEFSNLSSMSTAVV